MLASPSKPCYFLQAASINLDDQTLELSERVRYVYTFIYYVICDFAHFVTRVEGSFVAIAPTNNTNTVSIDVGGHVVLFESSSAVISNTLQV